jgi:hypothetical protein
MVIKRDDDPGPRSAGLVALTCIIVGQLVAGLVLGYFGVMGVERLMDLGRTPRHRRAPDEA